MDYFDELDKKKTEAAEKKLYDDSYNKQIKNSKKVLGITFGIFAALFIILGIIFLVAAEEEKEAGWVFVGLGFLYGIIALVYCLVKFKPNYEKYKERIGKYGSTNVYDLSMRVQLLEERIKKLEEQISEKN